MTEKKSASTNNGAKIIVPGLGGKLVGVCAMSCPLSSQYPVPVAVGGWRGPVATIGVARTRRGRATTRTYEYAEPKQTGAL